MPAMTIPELPVYAHRALEQRAAEHGRSVEFEAQSILVEALQDRSAKGLGSELREIVEKYGAYDLETHRDASTGEPATFE